MNVSASKIFNESNCMRFALMLLFPTMFDWIIETMYLSDEVWKWVYQKYGMSQILQKSFKKLQGVLLFQFITPSETDSLIQDLTTDDQRNPNKRVFFLYPPKLFQWCHFFLFLWMLPSLWICIILFFIKIARWIKTNHSWKLTPVLIHEVSSQIKYNQHLTLLFWHQ